MGLQRQIKLLRHRLHLRRAMRAHQPVQWQDGNVRVQVGEYTYGHDRTLIMHRNEKVRLTIGKYCSIASDVTIFLGAYHDVDAISTYPFRQPWGSGGGDGLAVGGRKADVTIGHDVWIGKGATIMRGVTIGNGAVVGAKAVVARDVAPYGIVVGNPARQVRTRFDDATVAQLQRLAWWDLPAATVKALSAQLTAAPTPDTLADLLRTHRGTN